METPEYKLYPAEIFFHGDFSFSFQHVKNRDQEFNLSKRFRREFWKITRILDGRGKLVIGERQIDIAPGTLMLISPNAATTFNMETHELEMYNILFGRSLLNIGGERVAEDTSDFFSVFSERFDQESQPEIYVQTANRKIDSIIQNMKTEREGKAPNWEAMIRLQLQELLLHMARNSVPLLRKIRRDGIVSFVSDYLNKNCREKVRLSELAAKIGISPNRLCTVYKLRTGETIKETLLKTRLERAADLLAHGKEAVGETAFLAGFSDLSYFCRAFRGKYFMSPSDYRRKFGKS